MKSYIVLIVFIALQVVSFKVFAEDCSVPTSSDIKNLVGNTSQWRRVEGRHSNNPHQDNDVRISIDLNNILSSTGSFTGSLGTFNGQVTQACVTNNGIQLVLRAGIFRQSFNVYRVGNGLIGSTHTHQGEEIRSFYRPANQVQN